MNIGAKTRRKPPDYDLDDTTEGVAVFVCLVNLSNHRSRCLRVSATQGVLVKSCNVLGTRNRGILGHTDGPDGNRVRENRNTQLTQEATHYGTQRDPGRSFPRTGALEHWAGIFEAILLHSGKVGVTGSGPGEGGCPTPLEL